MIKYCDIRHIHLELTTRCQAQCPGCDRNLLGAVDHPALPDYDMSLSQFQQIFSEEFLRQLDHIMFCGNLGDAAAAKDFLEIAKHVSDTAPNITMRLSTNGSLRTTEWWSQLALATQGRLEVWFALDGLAGTHEVYRKGTNWQKIIDNAVSFMSSGGPAYWYFIPFEHNQHQIKDCIKLSQQLGFKGFKTPRHVRANIPLLVQPEKIIWIRQSSIKKTRPVKDFPADVTLTEALDWANEQIQMADANTEIPPPVEEHKLHGWATQRDQHYCFTKKDHSIYVAANGEAYPCCYLGSFPRQMPGLPQVRKLINSVHNNVLEVGLEKAIGWFNLVEHTWEKQSIEQGLLEPCITNCMRN